MKSIFIDSLTYRWRLVDGEYYFGRHPDNRFPSFTANEKAIYVSEILMSLLLHDKIYININSVEEFIDLIGIESSLFNYSGVIDPLVREADPPCNKDCFCKAKNAL